MDINIAHDRPEALLDRWVDLFGRDPEATPFTHPQWVLAWWRHWHGEGELWLVTVHDAGELVGLAPLVLRRTGPFRVLRVLGEDVSDYWHVLARPERRQAVVAAVAAELHRRRSRWDALALTRLAPGSEVPGRLRAVGLRLRRAPPEPYPALALPESFDDYLAGLPSSHRSNLRRHLRRLDEGELELCEVQPSEVQPAVERWYALRLEQWQGAAEALEPMHATTRFRSFVADAVAGLLPAGLCSFWEFRRDGEVIGSYLNFADSRAYYWYLGGFSRSASRVGIGKIAIGHGIRSSIESGRREYDFMRGGESYKYWFGAHERLSHSYEVTSTTLRSLLTHKVRRAAGRR